MAEAQLPPWLFEGPIRTVEKQPVMDNGASARWLPGQRQAPKPIEKK
jgi:hypothetical protein